MTLRLKRAYEAPAAADGLRVLVDRLWPRGLSKDAGKIDLWFKEIAPSPALRTWYGHDPARWDEFCSRYYDELDGNPEAVSALQAKAHAGTVTLVYGARDTEHSHALALRDYLQASRKRAK